MLGGWVESFYLSRRRLPPIDAAGRARGMRIVELERASVRVRVVDEAGASAPTIVIVPDPPNTIEHYDELVELLRGSARVVVFEPPGFGLSLPRTARFGFTAADYTEITIDVIDRLRLEGVTLVYSCIGGYVGLMAARQRPDLIARLVLNQTPAQEYMVRWAKRFDKLGLLSMPIVGQAIILAAKNPATRFWYPAALPEGADAAPFLAPALAAQKVGGPYALASGIQAMRRLDLRLLEGVKQPTTICWGHADRTHAKTDPRSLLSIVPRARFESFDRCGHFPDLEDPQRFAEIVLDPKAP